MLGDVTNNIDNQSQRHDGPNPLSEKSSNIKNSHKNRDSYSKDASSSAVDSKVTGAKNKHKMNEKENMQVSGDHENRDSKFLDEKLRLNESHSTGVTTSRSNSSRLFDEENETTNENESSHTERRKQSKRYEDQEDDHESPDDEEDDAEAIERENARNKLKALLGPSKSKPKPAQNSSQDHKNALRKTLSQDEPAENDFSTTVDKMRIQLFEKLFIKLSDDDDEHVENVSKIFYEGKEGQKHLVDVLNYFFNTLKNKNNWNLLTISKPIVPQEPVQKEEPEPQDEESESDKDKIRRKLGGSKKAPASKNQQKNSSIEGLKSLLCGPNKPAKKTGPQDIKDVIKVDSELLNYGTVNPGKLLGSIITVTNRSEFEQTIELSIDTETETYDKEEITKNPDFEYIEEVTNQEVELTDKELEKLETEDAKAKALEHKKRYIPNSEIKNECWFIENPQTKDLIKKITLKLGPKCEQDFIIVLKTMQPKFKFITMSFLNFELPDQKSDEYTEKQIQKTQGESVSLNSTVKSKKLQVLL